MLLLRWSFQSQTDEVISALALEDYSVDDELDEEFWLSSQIEDDYYQVAISDDLVDEDVSEDDTLFGRHPLEDDFLQLNLEIDASEDEADEEIFFNFDFTTAVVVDVTEIMGWLAEDNSEEVEHEEVESYFNFDFGNPSIIDVTEIVGWLTADETAEDEEPQLVEAVAFPEADDFIAIRTEDDPFDEDVEASLVESVALPEADDFIALRTEDETFFEDEHEDQDPVYFNFDFGNPSLVDVTEIVGWLTLDDETDVNDTTDDDESWSMNPIAILPVGPAKLTFQWLIRARRRKKR